MEGPEFRIEPDSEGLYSSRQTAYEYVLGVLRRAILNGELKSGSRLVQAELAAMLDVSTTPVREALRDLATEGLVQFDPHRGAIVAELSSDDLHDIYEIRMVLEPLAMRQAVPNISDALVARLRKLHASMEAEPQSVDWVDRNRVFHMAVYETAASPRLASIIRNLQDASVMYIGSFLQQEPALRDEANHDHARILDALEKRDVEAAVAAVEDHLRTSIDAFDRNQG
ncbi:MAG TPA: GntR family transcriptional regulator [Acidimicrobiia bacterium]|jgi:DNA-binding GntR family transcriptional regulator|nr:GntR family transcriptional regulator [Acidimicrobiia bacterium]